MLKKAIIRNLATATATNATANQSSGARAVEQHISALPNGLQVASIDAHGPISHLVLTFRAGARYEQPDEAGLAHRLRNSVGLDSKRYEGSRLLWQSGSIGATLTSSVSQDFLTIHMAAPREYGTVALSLLGELGQPAFKPWDLEDSDHTLRYDLADADPFYHVYDGIHRAAYRNGPLANALLAPCFRVGSVNSRTLAQFADQHLVTGEASLFAFNLEHEALVDYAKGQPSIREGTANKQARPSPYVGGGDVRIAGKTRDAHVAIVGEGGKLSDTKSAAVQAVLAYVIGQSPNSKFTAHPGLGAVNKAVQQIANHNPVGVSALNVLHSDSGLCGVYLVADGTRIEPYVRAAASTLKQLGSNGPSQEDLEVAKAQATGDVLVRAEQAGELAKDQAAQLLVTGKPVTPLEFTNLIGGVSVDDVKKAAAKLTSKLSLAAYGTIDQVPYVDQL